MRHARGGLLPEGVHGGGQLGEGGGTRGAFAQMAVKGRPRVRAQLAVVGGREEGLDVTAHHASSARGKMAGDWRRAAASRPRAREIRDFTVPTGTLRASAISS